MYRVKMNRAERRRQLKADRKLVERGLDIANRDSYQIVALMRVLHEHVREAIEAKSVQPLMAFIYSSMTETAKRLANAPLACKRGCSHCCHIWVAASAPEVIYAVSSIPAAKRSACRQSVLIAEQETRDKSFDDRAGMVTRCPLLDDNLCSVYSTRPIVCRTAASADAAICERSYLHLSGEDIPTPFVFMAARSGYDIGLCGALRREGLADTASELISALKLVLETPDAEQRWLRGEDIFASLPKDPGSDLMNVPANRVFYNEAFG